MTFVTSWSPYSAPCASLRFSWNVLVLEYEGKLPPLVTFSDSSPVDKKTGNKRVFSAERWDENRKMSKVTGNFEESIYQKNKLTTATAFFYKLQKDFSISNYFHSSNFIPLTTQNKNHIVVKDMESFQIKLQCSEDY